MDLTIDSVLVQKLLAQQFPSFEDSSIVPVRKQGHDNRTFRIGEGFTARLPSQPSYADAVQKEQTALNALKGMLSIETPVIFSLGQPSDIYPLPWSIRHWLPGDTLEDTQIFDRSSLAYQLGTILSDLRSVPIDSSLMAGKHSFYRGCHPSVYGDEVIRSLEMIDDNAITNRCFEIWQNGIKSVWSNDPVWFHGDIAVGNILMAGDKISALIDFGTCGVGDPACDFVMAWTCFDASERQCFKDATKIDDATWQRAKSWALWKALICIAGLAGSDRDGVQARALNEILDDVN